MSNVKIKANLIVTGLSNCFSIETLSEMINTIEPSEVKPIAYETVRLVFERSLSVSWLLKEVIVKQIDLYLADPELQINPNQFFRTNNCFIKCLIQAYLHKLIEPYAHNLITQTKENFAMDKLTDIINYGNNSFDFLWQIFSYLNGIKIGIKTIDAKFITTVFSFLLNQIILFEAQKTNMPVIAISSSIDIVAIMRIYSVSTVGVKLEKLVINKLCEQSNKEYIRRICEGKFDEFHAALIQSCTMTIFRDQIAFAILDHYLSNSNDTTFNAIFQAEQLISARVWYAENKASIKSISDLISALRGRMDNHNDGILLPLLIVSNLLQSSQDDQLFINFVNRIGTAIHIDAVILTIYSQITQRDLIIWQLDENGNKYKAGEYQAQQYNTIHVILRAGELTPTLLRTPRPLLQRSSATATVSHSTSHNIVEPRPLTVPALIQHFERVQQEAESVPKVIPLERNAPNIIARIGGSGLFGQFVQRRRDWTQNIANVVSDNAVRNQ